VSISNFHDSAADIDMIGKADGRFIQNRYGSNLIGHKAGKKIKGHIWVIKSMNLALPEYSALYIRPATI
jgi:hypothetical protein